MVAATKTGFDHVLALSQCRGGDIAGLRRLYEAEAGFLLAVAARIVRHRETAEDVLHDTFIQIWRGARTFDPIRSAARRAPGWSRSSATPPIASSRRPARSSRWTRSR